MNLTHQQEARAQALHGESFVLLAHDHFFPGDDLEDLRRGKVTAKILMAVVDVRLWARDPEDYRRSIAEQHGWFSSACKVYRAIRQELGSRPELALIRSAE